VGLEPESNVWTPTLVTTSPSEHMEDTKDKYLYFILLLFSFFSSKNLMFMFSILNGTQLGDDQGHWVMCYFIYWWGVGVCADFLSYLKLMHVFKLSCIFWYLILPWSRVEWIRKTFCTRTLMIGFWCAHAKIGREASIELSNSIKASWQGYCVRVDVLSFSLGWEVT